MGNKISRGRDMTAQREMEEWRLKEFNRNNRRPSSSTSYPPSPTKRLRPTESSNKSNLFISRSEDDQLDQLEVIESFDSISVDPEALAHIVTQTRELNEQNRRVTKKQDVFISFLEQKKTRNVVRMDWSGSKLYALDPDALEHSIQRLQEVEQRRIILPNKQVLLAVTDRVHVSKMEVSPEKLVSLSLLRQTSVLFKNKQSSNQSQKADDAQTCPRPDKTPSNDPKTCPLGLAVVVGDLAKRKYEVVSEDEWEMVQQPKEDEWLLTTKDGVVEDRPRSHRDRGHPLGEVFSPVQQKACKRLLPEAIPVVFGHQRKKSKLKFDVVTAKVVEEVDREVVRKHVAYTIVMKRAMGEGRPAVISRRYTEFADLYNRLIESSSDSTNKLTKFPFPKRVVVGNLEARTVTERTNAFHKLLNLIANTDNILYSECFQRFLYQAELSEAVSKLKLGKFKEAAHLLETIFYIKEKLLTVSHVTVFEALMELVACLVAAGEDEEAFRYTLVGNLSLQLMPREDIRVRRLKVPFLKLAASLAQVLGRDSKPYSHQLSEMRSKGERTEGKEALLEVVKEKYIYKATHTSVPGDQLPSFLRASINFVCKDI